jgi:hypothetical protein
MNAILKSVVSAVKAENPNNAWRKAVTQEALRDIVAGRDPDLAPFQTFPWNDRDDDRNEKSFGLGSLKHTREYLLSDTRDLDKMRGRLEWLQNAPGKLSWMQSKLDSTAGAAARVAVLKLKNALQSAVFAKRAYKGTDAETISALALSVEQATVALRDGAKNAYEAVLFAQPSLKELSVKIDGLREAITKAGDIPVAIKKLDGEGAHLFAKRKLALMLGEIIIEREAQASAQAESVKEVEAIMASAVPSTPAPAPVSRKKVVKAPAKSRGEITAKSLADIGAAIVHRQVNEVALKRITKAEAIDLSGLPAEAFEEAAANAELAGEEEVLTSTESKAVILVRKMGNTRRFFVKQA